MQTVFNKVDAVVTSLKAKHLLPQKIATSTVLGLAALLILVIGSVSASVLVSLNQENRQQASTRGTSSGGGEGGGGETASYCGGKASNGTQCGATQFNGLGCTNSCQCGYAGGACAGKEDGASCYTNSQCKSGNCQNGRAAQSGEMPNKAVSGRCVSGGGSQPGGCFPGWLGQKPSCNATQFPLSETQNGQTCWQCREGKGIPSGATCDANVCICQSGPDRSKEKRQGEKCALECWFSPIVTTSSTCTSATKEKNPSLFTANVKNCADIQAANPGLVVTADIASCNTKLAEKRGELTCYQFNEKTRACAPKRSGNKAKCSELNDGIGPVFNTLAECTARAAQDTSSDLGTDYAKTGKYCQARFFQNFNRPDAFKFVEKGKWVTEQHCESGTEYRQKSTGEVVCSLDYYNNFIARPGAKFANDEVIGIFSGANHAEASQRCKNEVQKTCVTQYSYSEKYDPVNGECLVAKFEDGAAPSATPQPIMLSGTGSETYCRTTSGNQGVGCYCKNNNKMIREGQYCERKCAQLQLSAVTGDQIYSCSENWQQTGGLGCESLGNDFYESLGRCREDVAQKNKDFLLANNPCWLFSPDAGCNKAGNYIKECGNGVVVTSLSKYAGKASFKTEQECKNHDAAYLRGQANATKVTRGTGLDQPTCYHPDSNVMTFAECKQCYSTYSDNDLNISCESVQVAVDFECTGQPRNGRTYYRNSAECSIAALKADPKQPMFVLTEGEQCNSTRGCLCKNEIIENGKVVRSSMTNVAYQERCQINRAVRCYKEKPETYEQEIEACAKKPGSKWDDVSCSCIDTTLEQPVDTRTNMVAREQEQQTQLRVKAVVQSIESKNPVQKWLFGLGRPSVGSDTPICANTINDLPYRIVTSNNRSLKGATLCKISDDDDKGVYACPEYHTYSPRKGFIFNVTPERCLINEG